LKILSIGKTINWYLNMPLLDGLILNHKYFDGHRNYRAGN